MLKGAPEPTWIVSGVADDPSSAIEEGEDTVGSSASDAFGVFRTVWWPEKTTKPTNRYSTASEQTHNPRARKARDLRQAHSKSQTTMGSRSDIRGLEENVGRDERMNVGRTGGVE